MKQSTVMVSAYVSPEEYREIQAAAAEANQSISHYAAERILQKTGTPPPESESFWSAMHLLEYALTLLGEVRRSPGFAERAQTELRLLVLELQRHCDTVPEVN